MGDANIFKKVKNATTGLFKKGKPQKPMLQKGCVGLYDALKNSYSKQDEQANFGKDCGYEYDKSLSNDNQQVYFNKDKNHMIFSVAGTHNASDIGTDLKMMASGVKSTDRYRQAEMTLGKAKAKYGDAKTTGIGSSLGGAIVSNLDLDRKLTMNKAHTNPYQKTGSNEIHVRSYGDAVSFLSQGQTHTHTIKGGNILDPRTWLKAHSTDNIKKYGWKVPDS